ncbi:hypothetical protein QBC42DRAFT_185543 [Cladorrhinum samala]|uniref:HNH nuclease domain-containing protein n=1 Tax=Cladorrhinum samala TaxID=585594 RepID=A0AAV9HGP9_9PEZI|nr:hypothetical protein QBC42DRAFT_185543 [Cladorrhinum samala]
MEGNQLVGSVAAALLALYREFDGLEKPKKRRERPSSSFRSDAIRYYDGGQVDGDLVWCHATGSWWAADVIEAARVVPLFAGGDSDDLGEILFGSRSPPLPGDAGKSLLLVGQIKRWFDSYHLVIVPVDATENPITRWKVDVISSDIQNTRIAVPTLRGGDLDGKELQFRNDRRPATRFMYFHFVMALVRIQHVKRPGWQDIWARYYQQRPFPAQGSYIRRCMLLALATHFGPTEMNVVESWIADHGFDSPLRLTDDESTEAARRVLLAVHKTIAHAERDGSDDDEEEDEEDDSGDSGGDEGDSENDEEV